MRAGRNFDPLRADFHRKFRGHPPKGEVDFYEKTCPKKTLFFVIFCVINTFLCSNDDKFNAFKTSKKSSKITVFRDTPKMVKKRQKTPFLGVFRPDLKNRRGGYAGPPFLAIFGKILIGSISENKMAFFENRPFLALFWDPQKSQKSTLTDRKKLCT